MSEDVELGLMTFRQAASWLGWGDHRNAALRLKRLVKAKERKAKKAIIVWSGSERERGKVSKSALRQWMPELVPSKVTELQRDMRRHLHTLDQKIRDGSAAYVAEHVEPRLDELWERDEQIAKTVNELGARVASLIGTHKHR